VTGFISPLIPANAGTQITGRLAHVSVNADLAATPRTWKLMLIEERNPAWADRYDTLLP
jgi:predicted GIY-YIG superfamily endonuclease